MPNPILVYQIILVELVGRGQRLCLILLEVGVVQAGVVPLRSPQYPLLAYLLEVWLEPVKLLTYWHKIVLEQLQRLLLELVRRTLNPLLN
jgi:hypothetical protein